MVTSSNPRSQELASEWILLNQEVMALHDKGQYSRAMKVAQKALVLAEHFEDPEHPYLAASLNNLAGIYDAQGRYSEAEPLYRRSLEIRERLKGSGHSMWLQASTTWPNFTGPRAVTKRLSPFTGNR